MSNISIKLSLITQRILLIAFGLIVFLLVVFSAIWFFANSISKRVFQKEVAQFAVTLAPNDPQTHFASGLLLEQSSELTDLPKSLAEYEKAVALSPNNYLLWLAYGKSLERNGKRDKAEQALLKALELAPNYSEVHWVFGNILIRQEKNSDGFAAVRKAVDSNAKYANPAAGVAWDVFEGEINEIKSAIGDSIPVKASLAVLLANQERYNESVEVWKSIPENARKSEFSKDAKKLMKVMLDAKKYRAALVIGSDIGDEVSADASIGSVTNGGFENVVSSDKKSIYNWKIADGGHPKIGLNIERKRSGEKSLAVIFSSPLSKEFRNVSQKIAVESETKYEFKAFYRSTLETNAGVRWEIVDLQSGRILAETSAAIQADDWRALTANFSTGNETEGIEIRLVREKCTSTDCSVSGTIWFDDVSIN